MSGHLWVGHSRRPALPLARARVHQIVDVHDELRCRARDTFTMRHMVERPPQLAMIGDEFPDVVQTLARGLQYSLELRPGLGFGLAESHLYTAVGVDLAFTRRLNRQEDHVLESVDHGRLNAVRLRRWHTSERFQRQHHVALVVNGVVHVLADLEMSFAAARKAVIERLSQPRQFSLIHYLVSQPAGFLADPRIEV